jgi:calmodulin
MINNLSDFAKLTRALGQNYTPGELQTKLGTGKNLQGFLDLMSQTLVHEDTNQDVVEAFKVYDKDGNGLMDMVALRFVLLNQGDKLDGEQAEAIMSRISSHNGSFNYHSLIDSYSKMSGRG